MHRYTTPLTPKELLRLLRAARAVRVRDWCMILLAYRHGLLASEVCALKVDDVKDGLLVARRVKGARKTSQPLARHTTEPLLDEITALKAWLKVRPKGGSDYLFTSRKGGAIHKTQFFRLFQMIAKTVGLPPHKRQPRILRHSLAVHLLACNVDVALVSRMLGHRLLWSTMRYIKTTDREAAAAAQEAIKETF